MRTQIAITTALFLSIWAYSDDWVGHAHRFATDSGVAKARARAALKQIPDIENVIGRELSGQHRALALEVIAGLSLSRLVPKLKEAVSDDTTGGVYLTLAFLMVDDDTADPLLAFFSQNLMSAGSAARIAILDTLGRWGYAVSETQLGRLLQEASYEVRSAVIYYANTYRAVTGRKRYGTILQLGLRDPLYQVRYQTLHTLGAKVPPYRLIKAKPPRMGLDIRVVFGYKDARPARLVADRYERATFVDRISQPCIDDKMVCGFARDLSDPDVFEKEGVALRVVHSSFGPDDSENRRNDLQKVLTANAESEFYGGLKEADAVFYNGHSRDGGGPDFSPPKLLPNLHVNYGWYQANAPSLRRVLRELSSGPLKLDSLALFSCSSSTHFDQKIRSANSAIRVVTSDGLLYQSDAMNRLLATLEEYLRKKKWMASR